jgi:L-alanine-DL-glutamate epimerase-like enolase superfamily enzyme
MKIVDVEVLGLRFPLSESFGTSSTQIGSLVETVVRVRTDEGVMGIGQADVSPDKVEELKPLVIGEDPLRPERVWEKLYRTIYHFSAAMSIRRPPTISAIGAIDIALYDIMGKTAGVPVWNLLGGYREKVPAYASGGYYREGGVGTLVEELTGYVRDGHYKAVKMKVGKLSLEEDVARVRAARKALGDRIEIMLDANRAYDVDTAIKAAQLYAPYNIRWFEEPIRWYGNAHDLYQVAVAIPIPVASGESEKTVQNCRDVIARGGIRILQFDSTTGGGITPWRKVALLAEAYNIGMAPHHDSWIHVHTVGAVPNGLVLECFPNPERDPVWGKLYMDPPVVRDGYMAVPQKPGLGLELNEDTLRKYAIR